MDAKFVKLGIKTFEERIATYRDLISELFGGVVSLEDKDKGAAVVMYAELRANGLTHAEAYMVMVDQAGVVLADHGCVWGGNIRWIESYATSHAHRLYGETYKAKALREAGLQDGDE